MLPLIEGAIEGGGILGQDPAKGGVVELGTLLLLQVIPLEHLALEDGLLQVSELRI